MCPCSGAPTTVAHAHGGPAVITAWPRHGSDATRAGTWAPPSPAQSDPNVWNGGQQCDTETVAKANESKPRHGTAVAATLGCRVGFTGQAGGKKGQCYIAELALSCNGVCPLLVYLVVAAQRLMSPGMLALHDAEKY